MNKYFTSKNLALLLINLVPLYGVLFLGWQAMIIIVFYVAETLIVGTLHVFKMAVLYIMNHNNPKALAVDRSANSG
jgi:O-antigen ligase